MVPSLVLKENCYIQDTEVFCLGFFLCRRKSMCLISVTSLQMCTNWNEFREKHQHELTFMKREHNELKNWKNNLFIRIYQGHLFHSLIHSENCYKRDLCSVAFFIIKLLNRPNSSQRDLMVISLELERKFAPVECIEET